MATVRQYSAMLMQTANVVSRQMGVAFAGSEKKTRVMFRVMLGMFATLIKTLVDKGVLTDAEVQAALTASAADTYPDEPIEPAAVPDPAPVPDPPVAPTP